jgi:hypothetical protein
MNTTATSHKCLVIVGATGMVGGYALRYALGHPTVSRVTAIGRRSLGVSHPKVKEVLHKDFADCCALAEALSDQDAAIFCLGTYTGAVSDAELRKTTVDYTIEFARVLRGSSPNAVFSFLSGSGADQTGRSRMAFARYKGRSASIPPVYASCLAGPHARRGLQPPHATSGMIRERAHRRYPQSLVSVPSAFTRTSACLPVLVVYPASYINSAPGF